MWVWEVGLDYLFVYGTEANKCEPTAKTGVELPMTLVLYEEGFLFQMGL